MQGGNTNINNVSIRNLNNNQITPKNNIEVNKTENIQNNTIIEESQNETSINLNNIVEVNKNQEINDISGQTKQILNIATQKALSKPDANNIPQNKIENANLVLNSITNLSDKKSKTNLLINNLMNTSSVSNQSDEIHNNKINAMKSSRLYGLMTEKDSNESTLYHLFCNKSLVYENRNFVREVHNTLEKKNLSFEDFEYLANKFNMENNYGDLNFSSTVSNQIKQIFKDSRDELKNSPEHKLSDITLNNLKKAFETAQNEIFGLQSLNGQLKPESFDLSKNKIMGDIVNSFQIKTKKIESIPSNILKTDSKEQQKLKLQEKETKENILKSEIKDVNRAINNALNSLKDDSKNIFTNFLPKSSKNLKMEIINLYMICEKFLQNVKFQNKYSSEVSDLMGKLKPLIDEYKNEVKLNNKAFGNSEIKLETENIIPSNIEFYDTEEDYQPIISSTITNQDVKSEINNKSQIVNLNGDVNNKVNGRISKLVNGFSEGLSSLNYEQKIQSITKFVNDLKVVYPRLPNDTREFLKVEIAKRSDDFISVVNGLMENIPQDITANRLRGDIYSLKDALDILGKVSGNKNIENTMKNLENNQKLVEVLKNKENSDDFETYL